MAGAASRKARPTALRRGRGTGRGHLPICSKVAHLQSKTLRLLIEEAREEQRLVLAVTGVRGLYSIVAGRKAAAWRRVPRAEFWDAALEIDPTMTPPPDGDGEPEEADGE